MNLTKSLLGATIALSLLSSCGKTKDEPQTPTPVKVKYLKEIVEEVYSPQGNTTETDALKKRIIMRYNAKGVLLETLTHTTETNAQSLVTYSYNADGKLQKKTEVEGQSTQTTTYGYDASGKLVEEIILGSNDRQLHIARSEYNEKGQLIRLSNLNGSGDLESESLYTYNNAGQLSESNVYLMMGPMKLHSRRSTYEYDAQGREIMNTDYNTETNAVEKVLKTSYLAGHQNLIERTELSYTMEGVGSSQTISRYVYTFDQAQNWIRRVHYTDDTVREITIRRQIYGEE